MDRAVAASTFLALVLVMVVVHGSVGRSLIGVLLMAVLVGKAGLAIWFRWRAAAAVAAAVAPEAMAEPRVCLVMPLYNEDAGFAAASVRSMLSQTRLPDRIHVVDDGSTDPSAAAAVGEVLAAGGDRVEWKVTRTSTNLGKRNALGIGFRGDPNADVFICVDSDTVLDPGAIEEGLRRLADPAVAAVAGVVMASNWRQNVLTRLIDLRYVSAFLSERAAYSFFGAVLCCCGSLSFYRGAIVRENLDDFLDQRFLGQAATFGDDRRLTNYALRAGRVVLCESATASTAVPERFGHYLRQQVRWNKSFFRESVWVLGTFPIRAAAFWLTLWEVLAWSVLSVLIALSIVAFPMTGSTRAILPLLLLVPLAAYARCTAYLEALRPDVRPRDRLAVFLLAPAYAIVHLCVLMPLRFYALCTLGEATWGTRETVEVRLRSTVG